MSGRSDAAARTRSNAGRRVRLDVRLVRDGFARSRGHAAALVSAGQVTVDGTPAARVSAAVGDGSRLEVLGDPASDYASRAGDKLAAALAAFGPGGPAVQSRRCLDAGSSTGGFTDVLLRAGAASVLAVDVGHGQLRPELLADPRVTSLEGLDIRQLWAWSAGSGSGSGPGSGQGSGSGSGSGPGSGSGSRAGPAPAAAVPAPADRASGHLPAELTVADLSFISLRAVLPALAELTAGSGDLLTLVKPQFEVGRDRLPRTGVVRDPGDRARALVDVAAAGGALGLGVAGAVRSARPGRTGNVEFVLWWRRDADAPDIDALSALAVQEAGPGEADGAAELRRYPLDERPGRSGPFPTHSAPPGHTRGAEQQ